MEILAKIIMDVWRTVFAANPEVFNNLEGILTAWFKGMDGIGTMFTTFFEMIRALGGVFG